MRGYEEVAKMICPACRHPMIAVEYKQIELDFCLNCHGSWFDRDELALLLETANGRDDAFLMRNLLEMPAVRTDERKRKCPICGTKMRKLRIGQQNGVLVDACDQGDGLWFDGGEVEQLVNIVDQQNSIPAGPDPIIQYMKEVYQRPQG
jgi:uncharacterized protein